jgi:hypothetical protein
MRSGRQRLGRCGQPVGEPSFIWLPRISWVGRAPRKLCIYLLFAQFAGYGGRWLTRLECRFVFASVGWGPGVALYIVFGIAAGISGFILWRVFLALDSSRYPLLSFGDTYFRVYGGWSRHFINVAQSLQQFMTVCVIILGNGQIIAQLSSNKICFIACMIIFMAVGMLVGSIRSLQRLGWLANASVWMNIVSFIIM